MKKKLIVLLMFLLSCIAVYSNDINSQSDSNSFSSENFLKKLTSLTSKNPEKTEKFANYLKNEMKGKKEVSYFIKIDKAEKKITVLAENGEILFDEVVSEEVINSFPTYQTKIKEVEEKGLVKTYVEASYMVKTVRKPNFKNEKVEEPEKKEKTELSKLEDNIKLLLKSYDVLNSSIASIYEARDKMVTVQRYRNKTMTITGEEDGQKIKIVYNFDNSFVGGAMKIFVDNVLISQSKIKNLLPDGEIKLFNASGKISGMATAKEGKLDGVAKLFDENGNTIEEVIYRNNKIVKRIK
ncbi:hypothetical protein LDK18_06555 [Fusobacterium nucleatum subsp. nucleatum ATCC 23726]|uniref:MORN repeat protein n=1 Tax=Fusobacterium nucleatum subsp. nucleatum (strain ATCC 23726 / VPI 4351) TaxID=525283 RepID=D5RD87_FUSN2|nr:hypothetical protein [Fusobacterium nucleatum]EFG95221.1 hypothetical protein HMPREF0397_1172 [Fusobacterium nucleatum subsp. nucleatum ATCC 23726]ERT43196.1 hypothetical protein HMPREF1539_01045 [Fusobacterium nucleatum CTI-2]